MACYAIIAVRPAAEGKSRLADTLTRDQRISLNYNLFRHVFAVAREVLTADRIIVISRSEDLLREARAGSAEAHQERGIGLNEALAQGALIAVDRGASEVLTLSSDLPFVDAEDLRAMIGAAGDVVIATDRQHIGTNAMLMRVPLSIPFLYGPGSLAAHLAAAAKAGLEATVVNRPGLARDIDVPSDLAELLKG